MKTYLDCYSCFLRQALSAARRAGGSEVQQLTCLRRALALLETVEPDTSPAEVAYRLHRIVREEIGATDPYREAKRESTSRALALYPRLAALARRDPDPIDCALRLSIAGNIIDLGVAEAHEDLEAVVARVLHQSFAVDHRPQLRAALDKADRVLFLADNAGETVFDRVLIETLPIPATYVVKGGPILNDATAEDAREAGLEDIATIIDNGTDAPGTLLSLCSATFLETLADAPLVIAKGQANYETLSEAGAQMFCLLQVKCPVIAGNLGVTVGDIAVVQCRPPQSAE